MILGADGRSFADRATLPMSPAQVRWFLDPVAFLDAVPHLWSLNLKLVCRHCTKHGLDDAVRVVTTDQGWEAVCSCSQRPGVLPHATIRAQGDTSELLRKLGWTLACKGRCASEAGYADGVEANNDLTSQTLAITCGCTRRIHVLAHAPQTVVC